MKTIIAGSRGIKDIEILRGTLKNFYWSITEVVSGTARGVDRLGEMWADENNIPKKRFPADWDKYGKAAGFIRNVEMAEYAEALIAFWDGKSRGTAHMIEVATNKGLRVHVQLCAD